MGYQGTGCERDFTADRDANLRVQDVRGPVALCKLIKDCGGQGEWGGTKGK